MTSAFIRKGHGYENPSPGSGYEPCTAFDGFDVIASPMGGFDRAAREGRCGGPFNCDYQSHAIQLATDKSGSGLYILMQHGGGREVLKIPEFYDRGALLAQILALSEPLQYALLYTIHATADNARREAQGQTAQRWADAFNDGRIRKRRRAGRVSVYVETEFERDLRKGIVRPSAVAIDTATGEVRAA